MGRARSDGDVGDGNAESGRPHKRARTTEIPACDEEMLATEMPPIPEATVATAALSPPLPPLPPPLPLLPPPPQSEDVVRSGTAVEKTEEADKLEDVDNLEKMEKVEKVEEADKLEKATEEPAERPAGAPATFSEEGPMNAVRDPVTEPVVGDAVAAVLGSGGARRAKVVAVEAGRVYVHFVGCDRRLDRWITSAEVLSVADIAEAAIVGEEARAKASGSAKGNGRNGRSGEKAKIKAGEDTPRATRSSKRATRGTRGTARVAAAKAAAMAGKQDGITTSETGNAAVEVKTEAQERLDDTVMEMSDSGGEAAAVVTEPEPARKVTRSRRRALEEFNPVSEKEVGNEVVARMERAREEHTKVRNIGSIVFGMYDVDVWYFSPYPGNCANADVLYVCPFCLKYMRSPARYDAHCAACVWEAPPGALIYTDSKRKVTVYEVDGLVNVAYSQRLCLLGKLFLDHKTLYFDVAPFLFYVVCFDGELAGFFSKEKPLLQTDFNLACIVTLPQHQRKGVGRFLIALSYELTRREQKTGSPERPLSDLGQLSYRSYWTHAVLAYVRTKKGAVGISAKDVAAATGIRLYDISTTLKSMGILTIWKGETYVDTNQKTMDQARGRVKDPRLPLIPSLLKWSPLKKPEKDVFVASPAPSPRLLLHNPSEAASAAQDIIAQRNARRRETRRLAAAARVNGTNAAGTSKPKRAQASPPPQRDPEEHQRILAAALELSVLPDGTYKGNELFAMKHFVKLHTAEKIRVPLNSARGILTTEVKQLAEAIGISTERCRKKLKRIAALAVEDPSTLYSANISSSPLPSPSASPIPSPPPIPLQLSSSSGRTGVTVVATVEAVPGPSLAPSLTPAGSPGQPATAATAASIPKPVAVVATPQVDITAPSEELTSVIASATAATEAAVRALGGMTSKKSAGVLSVAAPTVAVDAASAWGDDANSSAAPVPMDTATAGDTNVVLTGKKPVTAAKEDVMADAPKPTVDA